MIRNEDWLIFVTTDHGGLGFGHKETVPETQTIFILAAGRGVRPGKIIPPPCITDISVTSLAHIGIPIDKEWDLDGCTIALKGLPKTRLIDRFKMYIQSLVDPR